MPTQKINRSLHPPHLSTWRQGLTVQKVRALGIPRSVISDYEINAALTNDHTWFPGQEEEVAPAAYDRRGLLNIIAFLAEASPQPEPLHDIDQLLGEVRYRIAAVFADHDRPDDWELAASDYSKADEVIAVLRSVCDAGRAA